MSTITWYLWWLFWYEKVFALDKDKFLAYLAVGKFRAWLLFCASHNQITAFCWNISAKPNKQENLWRLLTAKPMLCQARAPLCCRDLQCLSVPGGAHLREPRATSSSYCWQHHLGSMKWKAPKRSRCQFWVLTLGPCLVPGYPTSSLCSIRLLWVGLHELQCRDTYK